uniref:Uncharacterized protein n=1 Tax=Oryza sativa subsp. japonica TaxID=39947 RepID=Q6Z2V4_ORYSJ|nr:hypothetical protein [Oryza sativa Japonica Group]BAD16107.1 hypothetical protein [Oryza sativa Japonica Group]
MAKPPRLLPTTITNVAVVATRGRPTLRYVATRGSDADATGQNVRGYSARSIATASIRLLNTTDPSYSIRDQRPTVALMLGAPYASARTRALYSVSLARAVHAVLGARFSIVHRPFALLLPLTTKRSHVELNHPTVKHARTCWTESALSAWIKEVIIKSCKLLPVEELKDMVAIGPDPTTELPFQEYSHLRCRLALADSFLDLIFGTFVVVLMAPFSDSVTDNTRDLAETKGKDRELARH